MLPSTTKVMPTLAVTDLARARRFYGEILGLEEERAYESAASDALYRVGDGWLYVYERPAPSGSTATACAFAVDDVEKTVGELREAGVTFEEYDVPEMDLKTKDGIATVDGVKTAWFKDPSGNILALDDSLAAMERRRAQPGRGAGAEPTVPA